MSTSFTRTREQIAARVLGKVIKLGTLTPNSGDLTTIYEAIDLRLKEIHRRGIFWRKVTTVPVTFSLGAGVISASAGNGDILFPIKMTYSNGSNDDPVSIVGIIDYAGIPDKTRSGNPEKALWKGGSEFLLYPVPAANGTAKLVYEKIADDTSASAAIDIEVSMIRPMIDLIKYDVADDWAIDENIVRRWRLEAEQAERDILKLSAQLQHVDLTTVPVDNFDSGNAFSRRDSDYGR